MSHGLGLPNQNSARLRFNQTSLNNNTRLGTGWTSQRSDNKDKELFYEGLYVDGLLRKKRKIENSQAGILERAEAELAECTF